MSYSGTMTADYCGFWRRVGAALIDGIILWGIGLAWHRACQALWPGLYPGIPTQPRPEIVLTAAYWLHLGRIWLISLVPQLIYVVGLTASAWQGTVGKVALGMIVVDGSGERLTVWRSLGRYFARTLSGLILCIGFLMVGWTERKQGLHDIIAGTLVIKKGSLSQSSVF